MAAFETLKKLDIADLHALPPLQRVLLVTDGTLTEILEAYGLEPIRLIKLSQQIAPASPAAAALDPGTSEKFIERKILLQGADSGRVHVYAESIIAFERLDPKLRDDLLASATPLGRLWLEHRLETFKELIDVQRRPTGELAAHFGIEANAPLLMRSYRVFSGGRAVMVISEYFGAA